MSFLEKFNALLFHELIPEFCSDPSRCMDVVSFVSSSNRTTEADAEDFLRAWNAGLCVNQGRGQYLIGQATVKEQFFWSGTKRAEGRPFTLWMEPIITVAAIGRLHLDYLWPISELGSQSKDWAFDIVAQRQSGGQAIAGEVKKSRLEVDDLVDLMGRYGSEPDAPVPVIGKRRNAFKKVASLRAHPTELLWVVGPARYEYVFSLQYDNDGLVAFHPVTTDSLAFR